MLTGSPRGTALFVCTTCRGPDRTEGAGAALAADVATLAADPTYAAVTVAPVECLWSCAQGVAAQIHHRAKIGYVMGGFVAGDARALLDFALAHDATGDGVVPYAAWPAGVLGHFIARTPPAHGTIS